MEQSGHLILGKISINPLIKAREKFTRILENSKDETDEIAAIKLFVICYELSWKTLKRVLEIKGLIDINNPRDVFRESAVQGLIAKPEAWFAFQEDRNRTVHTYNQEVANDIFASLGGFQIELNKLVEILQTIK